MQRKDLLEKQRTRIAEWAAGIEELSARSGKMRADAGIKYENTMDDLNQRLERILGRIDNIRRSGTDSWVDLRTGVEGAWGDLKEAINRAKSRFS